MVQLIKKTISVLAYYFGLWHLLYFAAGLKKRNKLLAIFTFHRVIDPAKGEKFYLNYDKGLDKITFEMHVRAILRYFKVINQDDFLDVLSGRKKIKKRSALITFDDADSDFIPNALPILQKYKLPSVIFAPTDFIDTDKRFWHLKVSNLFKKIENGLWFKIQEKSDSLPDQIAKIIKTGSVADENQKAKTCQSLVNALDKLDQSSIESVIARIESVTGADYILGIRCMNWNELREIQQSGVVVESHSVKHRKLGEQTPEEVKRELIDSRKILENKLDCKVKTICYPAGSFNDSVIKIVEEANYMAAYTTLPGRCRYPIDGDYIFRLPRYTIYGADKYSTDLFMGKIALESIKDE